MTTATNAPDVSSVMKETEHADEREGSEHVGHGGAAERPDGNRCRSQRAHSRELQAEGLGLVPNVALALLGVEGATEVTDEVCGSDEGGPRE